MMGLIALIIFNIRAMRVDVLSITGYNYLPSLTYVLYVRQSKVVQRSQTMMWLTGSIIVKQIKFNLKPSLASSVYGPIRSTYTKLFPEVEDRNLVQYMSMFQFLFLAPLASITKLYVLGNMQSHLFPIYNRCQYQSLYYSSIP